jgi:intein/homing endonuclease
MPQATDKLIEGIASEAGVESATDEGEEAPDEWRDWLRALFPQTLGQPFGPRHERFWEWVWSIGSDDDPRPYVGVWPRGGGKCLHPETQVTMATGDSRPISDVSAGDEVMSFDRTSGEFKEAEVWHRWDNPDQDLLRIETKTGRVLRCSPDHKIRTFTGWKKAGKLTISDRVATPREFTNIEGEQDKPTAAVRFAAYMLAEGCTTVNKYNGRTTANCQFSSGSPRIRADFKRCAKKLGFGCNDNTEITIGLSEGAREWCREHGLMGAKSKNKTLPKWVYGCSTQQIKEFFGVFMDCDGWFTHRKAGITLASRELLNDLRKLGLRIGLYGVWAERPNEHAGAWGLRFDQECFSVLQSLPYIEKGSRADDLTNVDRYSNIDVYPPEIFEDMPFGWNRALRDEGVRVDSNVRTGSSVTRRKLRRAQSVKDRKQWSWLEDAEVMWAEVTSIEKAGSVDTVDLEVAPYRNFIANGVVVHNSTSAELALCALGLRGICDYAVYLQKTEGSAEDRLDSIKQKLRSTPVERYYPEHSGPEIGEFGNPRGWSMRRLVTKGGFKVDATGIESAVRGLKVDDQRPDLLVIDDIDQLHDSADVVRNKLEILKGSVMPAMADTGSAVIAIQNLIHPNGIFARLADGRADWLQTRIVDGPEPAVRNLETERKETESGYRDVIVGGEATWEGQSLEDCQHKVDQFSLEYFKRECQNEVKEKEGALWSRAQLDAVRCGPTDLPSMQKVVVGVDPAGGTDEVGIIVAGKGRDGKAYVLEDCSMESGDPNAWAKAVRQAYYNHEADCVIGESNYGGKMVEDLVTGAVEMGISYESVNATRGKKVRAKPIAGLYGDSEIDWEDTQVHHVGTYNTLETQMTSWVPGNSDSPDRLDSLVWAVRDLLIKEEQATPELIF